MSQISIIYSYLDIVISVKIDFGNNEVAGNAFHFCLHSIIIRIRILVEHLEFMDNKTTIGMDIS